MLRWCNVVKEGTSPVYHTPHTEHCRRRQIALLCQMVLANALQLQYDWRFEAEGHVVQKVALHKQHRQLNNNWNGLITFSWVRLGSVKTNFETDFHWTYVFYRYNGDSRRRRLFRVLYSKAILRQRQYIHINGLYMPQGTHRYVI
jgi:hypothetical protein